MLRASRALAALEDVREIGSAQLRRVAPLALRHRLRRDPLDSVGSAARVARALEAAMPAPGATPTIVATDRLAS